MAPVFTKQNHGEKRFGDMIQAISRFLPGLVAVLGCFVLVTCGDRSSGDHRQQADSNTVVGGRAQVDSLLVPGQLAGTIVLGQADSSLLTTFGPPDYSDAAMGKAVLAWDTSTDNAPYRLSVFTSRDMGNDETARIQQIRITSPGYSTQQGIRVGSTLDDISDVYNVTVAETYRDGGHAFSVYKTDEGIAFELDTANRCVAIIVHEKDASVPTYLPLRASD